jgi:hypothetical protein
MWGIRLAVGPASLLICAARRGRAQRRLVHRLGLAAVFSIAGLA